MPFWSRRSAPSREAAWRAFAAELELEDGSELAGKLHDHLDLGSGELKPIYTLSRPNQPRLILFDQLRERSGPTGSVSSLRTCVLLRARTPVEFVSMRITRRLSPALEAIEAGRTGSSRLVLAGEAAQDHEFDALVSVYTRDEAGARRLLNAPARQVIGRLLTNPGERVGPDNGAAGEEIPETVSRAMLPPVVIVGSVDVLLTLDDQEPVDFSRLTDLTADMMGLYAALLAARSALEERH